MARKRRKKKSKRKRTSGCKVVRKIRGKPQYGCWNRSGKFVLKKLGFKPPKRKAS